MRIQIDENNYFTGNYVIIGDIENGVEAEGFPEELTYENAKAWKYEDGIWSFDEQKYAIILEELKKEEERQVRILDNEQLSNLLYDLSKAFILHDTEIKDYDESISNSFKNIITTSIKLHQLDRELYSVKINDLNKRKKITNKDVEELLSLLDQEYSVDVEN